MVKTVTTLKELKDLYETPVEAYVLFGYGNDADVEKTVKQFGYEDSVGYLIPGKLLNSLFHTGFNDLDNFLVVVPADPEMVTLAGGTTLFEFIYELEDAAGYRLDYFVE